MSKKNKILLPFFLYEELENMDQLNPDEMKSFMISLRKYCDSVGKDFNKVCKELDLEEPEWSGKLTPRQIEALDQGTKSSSLGAKDSTWSINPETGLVDVKGNFNGNKLNSIIASSGNLIGIKFGKVEGDFYLGYSNLTSLEGCPLEVTGNFVAFNNKLQDLKGSPKKIGGRFDVSRNPNLKSLEGAPEEVDGDFSVEECRNLDSLRGCPKKIGGSMTVSTTSIRDLDGCPKEIGQYQRSTNFNASFCYNLISLEGAPVLLNNREDQSTSLGKEYNFFDCTNLYSLEGLPLDKIYTVHLNKNGLKPGILKSALSTAKNTKSWIVAYLTMFTDPEFIKTGKAPKDPIREKLSPANIKKEIEENGERFVVGLKSIWNDFRVKKILKEIEIPEETKADADLLSALDDVGL